jgi:hypothetical protein
MPLSDGRAVIAALLLTVASCASGSATGDGGADAGASSAGVCPGDGVGCGIDSLSQATCTCNDHGVASCTCPRPAAWTALGGECGDSACLTEGGPCSPQGYASSVGAPSGATVLEGQPCVMNGNVCFTAESDGKHGCVCASDPSGDFVMRCGLIEGWFSNNGMQTTY